MSKSFTEDSGETVDFDVLVKQYPHAVDCEGIFHIDWMDDPKARLRDIRQRIHDR